jgi:protein phosphatase
MGTTLTALWTDAQSLLIAQVGDSRAYLLRAGVLHRCTRDHSLVEDLVRKKKLTPEQARSHPRRHVITRALGSKADVKPDIFEWDRQPGDVWLLCTDGLTDMLEDASIHRLLAAMPLEVAGDALLRLALESGGIDNVSLVLLKDDAMAEPVEAGL